MPILVGWDLFGAVDHRGAPSATDIRNVGGAAVFGDHRVYLDERGLLGPWKVARQFRDGKHDIDSFARYRDACAEARRLERERLNRLGGR